MEQFFKPVLLKALICALIAITVIVFSCKQKSTITKNEEEGKTKIKIKGSESELHLVNYFAGEFVKEYNDVLIRAAGGGSGLGIKALLDNNVDIAISSRPLNEEELEIARLRGEVLLPVVVALDAVAIITNPSTGVDSLSLGDLKHIFNGTVKNWKEVGGADLPVKVYRRGDHSGTYFYVSDRLSIKDYAKGAVVKKENPEIIDAVKKNMGAIGYVSLGSLIDANGRPNPDVWAISTFYDGGRAHSPYELEAVKSGEYPLIRPLYQYVIGRPKGELFNFLNYQLSYEQQKKLEAHGYFPINQIHRELNNKYIPGINDIRLLSTL